MKNSLECVECHGTILKKVNVISFLVNTASDLIFFWRHLVSVGLAEDALLVEVRLEQWWCVCACKYACS